MENPVKRLKGANMVIVHHENGVDFIHREGADGDWKIETFMGCFLYDDDMMADQLVKWEEEETMFGYEIHEEG